VVQGVVGYVLSVGSSLVLQGAFDCPVPTSQVSFFACFEQLYCSTLIFVGKGV
jgi:hypothetical protein